MRRTSPHGIPRSHAQKIILEPATLQIVFEFAPNMVGQRSPGGGQVREQERIVLFDDLIQQRVFRSMAHMGGRCRSGCGALNCSLRFHALRHPLPKGSADAACMRPRLYSAESAYSGGNYYFRDARLWPSNRSGSWRVKSVVRVAAVGSVIPLMSTTVTWPVPTASCDPNRRRAGRQYPGGARSADAACR
jgi:hypothetical protein